MKFYQLKAKNFTKLTNFNFHNFPESSSSPQIPVGGQFGQINNNGTNIGGLSNRTGSAPGGGYAGEYYSHHSNESLPTSPSLSSGSLDVQNTNISRPCDCNQMTNVQEMVPTDASSAGQGAGAPEVPSAPGAGDVPSAPGAGDAGSAGSSK